MAARYGCAHPERSSRLPGGGESSIRSAHLAERPVERRGDGAASSGQCRELYASGSHVFGTSGVGRSCVWAGGTVEKLVCVQPSSVARAPLNGDQRVRGRSAIGFHEIMTCRRRRNRASKMFSHACSIACRGSRGVCSQRARGVGVYVRVVRGVRAVYLATP